VSPLELVADEAAVKTAADEVRVAVGREQHEARRRVADTELDPALLVVVRLIRVDAEAELLGEEAQRGVLIANGNGGELDRLDPADPPARDGSNSRRAGPGAQRLL